MKKHVLISGANRGIGLAMVEQYLAKGDEVYAVCRQPSQALIDSAAHIIAGVDVTKPQSYQNITASLGQQKLDVLVNNAGILRDEVLGGVNYDSIQEQFMVNALAPLRLTEYLLPHLSAGAKVAMVTSRMGSIADNGSGGRYGYRMSKAALNAASMSLSLDLAPRGVAVVILHPGYVQTDMVGNRGDISATEAAQRLVERIAALTLERSGQFLHSNGERLPW